MGHTLWGPCLAILGPAQAQGWSTPDSPRNMLSKSGVNLEIHALGGRFVAIFRFVDPIEY